MTTLFFYWLIAALLFLILEIGHPGLFLFLSFTVGACASAFATFWIDSFMIQGYIFLFVTVVAILVFHRWLVRAEPVRVETHYHSNTEALIGKKGNVLHAIEPSKAGSVKIDGEIWLARAPEHIVAGQLVEVVAVRGAHVQVRRIN